MNVHSIINRQNEEYQRAKQLWDELKEFNERINASKEVLTLSRYEPLERAIANAIFEIQTKFKHYS